jgi:hypothetical protein
MLDECLALAEGWNIDENFSLEATEESLINFPENWKVLVGKSSRKNGGKLRAKLKFLQTVKISSFNRKVFEHFLTENQVFPFQIHYPIAQNLHNIHHGMFVDPKTKTFPPSSLSKPSRSERNSFFNRFDASCSLDVLFDVKLSNSSMKIIDGE